MFKPEAEEMISPATEMPELPAEIRVTPAEEAPAEEVLTEAEPVREMPPVAPVVRRAIRPPEAYPADVPWSPRAVMLLLLDIVVEAVKLM